MKEETKSKMTPEEYEQSYLPTLETSSGLSNGLCDGWIGVSMSDI